jgi:hypothetical protein
MNLKIKKFLRKLKKYLVKEYNDTSLWLEVDKITYSSFDNYSITIRFGTANEAFEARTITLDTIDFKDSINLYVGMFLQKVFDLELSDEFNLKENSKEEE